VKEGLIDEGQGLGDLIWGGSYGTSQVQNVVEAGQLALGIDEDELPVTLATRA
jgi:hypothetical protein